VLSPCAHCRSLVQDPHGVAAPDDARRHDISVDAEAGTATEFPQVQQVLVRDRPQDAGVVREVPLGQRRHHAARGWDGSAEVVFPIC
jgi:hypothetical protein